MIMIQNLRLTSWQLIEPTEGDFWNAAYDFDPLAPTQPPGPTTLVQLLTLGQLQPIMLGKLYGQTTLKLLPAIGVLPNDPIPNFHSALSFAATDSAAIIYPDGHPAIETSPLALPSDSQTSVKITDSQDDKLRRVAALGWVIQSYSEGQWGKTGHVLVMDMGDKRARDRHPWFVLVSEWPTDGEETAEGTFTYRAEERIYRDDDTEWGVFPGSKNRTPICMIKPMGKSDSSKPVLNQFGKEFNFDTVRLGGHRRHRPSIFGPALAKIRDWYWDPETKQEVCCTDGGLEYMRYDRETMEYSFPDFAKLSIEGELGLYGELEKKPTLEVASQPVSMDQRLQQSAWTAQPPNERRRITTMAEF